MLKQTRPTRASTADMLVPLRTCAWQQQYRVHFVCVARAEKMYGNNTQQLQLVELEKPDDRYNLHFACYYSYKGYYCYCYFLAVFTSLCSL
jgi:hypothetical protein